MLLSRFFSSNVATAMRASKQLSYQSYALRSQSNIFCFSTSTPPPPQPQQPSSNDKSSDEKSTTTQNESKTTDAQNVARQAQQKSNYQKQLESRFSAERIHAVQSQIQQAKVRVFNTQLALRGDPTGNNFKYPGDTLITTNLAYKPLIDTPKPMIVLSSIWGSLAYTLSTFVHEYLAYPALVLAAGSVLQYLGRRRIVRKTIERIEFVPHEIEKINVYFYKQQDPVLCYVNSIEIVDVTDDMKEVISPFRKPKPTGNSNEEENQSSEESLDAPIVTANKQAKKQAECLEQITPQKDAHITLNIADVTGEQYLACNLFIFENPEITAIPNFNLLTAVLNADVVRLNKFKIVDTLPDSFLDDLFKGIDTKSKQQQEQIEQASQQESQPLIERTETIQNSSSSNSMNDANNQDSNELKEQKQQQQQQEENNLRARQLETDLEREMEMEIARFQRKGPKK